MVSASIGSADEKGLKGWFNRHQKIRCLKKIYKEIDKVTNYLSNEEIEDYIKCACSVYGQDIYKDNNKITKLNILGKPIYVVNILSPTVATFHWYDTPEDGGKVVHITYRDGEMLLSTTESNGVIRYNANTMKEFEFDPRSVLATIIREEMKNMCYCLAHKKEAKYVYGFE
jgi:hypothetical protein